MQEKALKHRHIKEGLFVGDRGIVTLGIGVNLKGFYPIVFLQFSKSFIDEWRMSLILSLLVFVGSVVEDYWNQISCKLILIMIVGVLVPEFVGCELLDFVEKDLELELLRPLIIFTNLLFEWLKLPVEIITNVSKHCALVHELQLLDTIDLPLHDRASLLEIGQAAVLHFLFLELAGLEARRNLVHGYNFERLLKFL